MINLTPGMALRETTTASSTPHRKRHADEPAVHVNVRAGRSQEANADFPTITSPESHRTQDWGRQLEEIAPELGKQRENTPSRTRFVDPRLEAVPGAVTGAP
jgi:hypothetical protein